MQRTFQFIIILFSITEPPSIYGMRHETVVYNSNPLLVLNWNASGHFEEFFVVVSPSLASGAIFITINTSLQLPILYNQEYHISVVAYNCAGNSTAVHTESVLFQLN